MKNRETFMVLVMALFLCSCASTSTYGPLVVHDGKTGKATLGRVELTFPGDFDVVGEKSYFGSETFNQDMVILRKKQGPIDTVIVLSYQRITPSGRFRVAAPEGEGFSQRIITWGVGPLPSAATYLRNAPVERGGESHRMVCKMFTGYITYISTRYRIDIFQNFAKDLDSETADLDAANLKKFIEFHKYCLGFVKNNLSERTCVDWIGDQVAGLKAGSAD